MTSFFGYNVFTNNHVFRDHVQRLQPGALLFLDDDGGAADAANRLPNCRVIAREVRDAYEKNMHRTPGEVRRYVQRRAQQVDRRCYINVGCEPAIDRLDVLVSEYLPALEWAVANRVKVAAPHLAVGGLDERHWPILAPLARYMAGHPDLLLWTVDEYWAGHAFSGVQDPSLNDGNEIGHIHPDSWKPSPTDTYYHAGRSVYGLFEYMQGKGWPLPLTVITECGPDALQDVEQWRESLIHTGPFPKISGWRTLQNQWNAWYRIYGWTAPRAFMEMLKAKRRVIYGPWPNVIGACLFVYGRNGDSQWLPYDLNDPNLLTMLETLTVETEEPPVTQPTPPPPITTPVPKPADAGAPVRARLKSGYNLRYGPGKSYGIVTVLAPDLTVTYYPNETTKTQADGFEWVYVQWNDKAGFVAHQGQFDPLPALNELEPTTFWMSYPLAQYTITDRFNAPRNYSAIAPNKLQLHEGVDFGTVPPGNANAPVLAGQEGTVEAVGNNPGGYGIYVRLKHEWSDGERNNEVWRSWYGHLSSSSVAVGQAVKRGDVLGRAGMTGNADGVHVHVTLTNDRRGLDGYVVDKVVDPLPLFREEPLPQPEPEPEPEPTPEPVPEPPPPDIPPLEIMVAAGGTLTIDHLTALLRYLGREGTYEIRRKVA